jgi:hypothetical protein
LTYITGIDAWRPESLKLILSTGSGANKAEPIGVTMDRQAAFPLTREILQHVYRSVVAGK